MKQESFQPGDIVTLNSGSAAMTILSTDRGFADVAMYNYKKGEVVFVRIDEAALSKEE